MKKSTIFLIILVYIASFIIVGLFGVQIRAHDEIIYVESIALEKVDESVYKSSYIEGKKTYNFVSYYQDNLIVKIKANVLPANVTHGEVKVNYDSEICKIEVVEAVYIYVTVFNDGYGSVDFDVVSTDGKDLTVKATLLII